MQTQWIETNQNDDYHNNTTSYQPLQESYQLIRRSTFLKLAKLNKQLMHYYSDPNELLMTKVFGTINVVTQRVLCEQKILLDLKKM